MTPRPLSSLLLLLFALSGASRAEVVETVTVTASRTPIAVADIGSSVTVIDREEIEARGSLFLADLLRGVPGIAISRAGSVGSLTQARVRGAEANHMLVLIDGVAINDAFAGDEVPLELLTSFDLERVEIVRGPQSGLWGADALAGVIHLITRAAGDAAEVSLESGSFGTVRGAGRVGVERGAARLSLSGSYLDTEGANVARSGNEEDGASNGNFSARFDWNRDESPFDMTVVARHTDAAADYDDIDFVSSGLPIDANNRTETDITLLHATGRFAPDDGAWRHEFRSSFSSSDTKTFPGATASASTAIDKLALSIQSSVELGSAASPLGRRLTLALDHRTRGFEQRGNASPFGDPNQDQDLRTTGAAVEFRVGEAGRWSLSASLRHDDHSDFDDATNYRATASYRVAAGTRLRASGGTGQKPPTFLERFGFLPDTFIGNPELKPETSHGWEVGVDQQITQRSHVAVTYFDATLEDEINGFFFDGNLGAFTARNEPSDSDRGGVEIAFDTSFTRTHVGATYTFTDATQPDGTSGDQEELRRPRHMVNLRVRHAFARIPLDLQLNLAHTGSQTDVFFPPFPQPSESVRLQAYLLAEVTARYRIGETFELCARVENALDEDYEDLYGFATPGIGTYVGMRYRWQAGQ